MIGRLLPFTAYALTLACIYVEWEAYAAVRAAARALDARLADAEREILTRKELESLIGRTPDRTATQADGSILVHYSWKGVVRRHSLRVEYIKGTDGEEIMVNNRFD